MHNVTSCWSLSELSDIIGAMKIYRALALLSGLLLFSSLDISAQTAADSEFESVFAPFPDKIRVGSRNNEVIISWEDSPDALYGYKIFRLTELPDLDNYTRAEMIGETLPGIQLYTYKATDDTAYYYFILAKTEAGSVYEIFIPLRNVTLLPVQVAVDPVQRPSLVVPGTVEALTAEQAGDAVKLTFKPSADAGRIVLYRATSPILTAVNLLESILVAVLDEGTGAYLDYPIPGIPYFYAVIPEAQLKAGSTSFIAGKNSTRNAVTIPAGLYRTGLPSPNPVSRSIPLPLLVLDRGIRSDSPLSPLAPRASATVSADTEKAINDVVSLAGRSRSSIQPVKTLPRPATRSGEEALLFEIVSRDFQGGNYSAAVRNLTLFLSLPRSSDIAAQARFYRGQSYVLLGQWREAFFEFLQVQPYYYRESKLWLDYLLDILQSL